MNFLKRCGNTIDMFGFNNMLYIVGGCDFVFSNTYENFFTLDSSKGGDITRIRTNITELCIPFSVFISDTPEHITASKTNPDQKNGFGRIIDFGISSA